MNEELIEAKRRGVSCTDCEHPSLAHYWVSERKRFACRTAGCDCEVTQPPQDTNEEGRWEWETKLVDEGERCVAYRRRVTPWEAYTALISARPSAEEINEHMASPERAAALAAIREGRTAAGEARDA